MNQATGFLNKYVVPPLTVVSENTYMKAIRAGMVAIVPLTIIGGFFMIVAYMPIHGSEDWVEPYLPLLEIPYKATFGLLSIFVCFSIAYNLGKEFKQETVLRLREKEEGENL